MTDVKDRTVPDATTRKGGPKGEVGRGLIVKLTEVMAEMRAIKKEGFNSAQKYAFVRESDVAEKASQLLAERHIWIEQTVIAHEREELYRTSSGSTMWLTTVQMEFQFVDGDTGEVTPARMFVGYGADIGDKGIYKAMTGAEKYFLMKSFLVSTGDDPEADEKVDKEAAAAGARQGPRVAPSGAQAKRGGKSDTTTDVQMSEIARIIREGEWTSEAFRAAVQLILGKAPGAEEKAADWLHALSAKEAGQLIEALADMKPGAATDVDDEVDGSGDPGSTEGEVVDTEPMTVI
jgi:hypothetical protein